MFAVILAGYQRRWNADDAFIDFRYVQQIQAGHGLVFNVGQRVEAFTSPLWLGLLTLFSLVAPTEVVAIALGIVLSAVGVVAAQLGAIRLTEPDADGVSTSLPGHAFVPFGAFLFLVLPPVWDFITSGLETGLTFAYIGVCFWYLSAVVSARDKADFPRGDDFIGRHRIGASLLIGLGPLIRPDLAIITLCFMSAITFEYLVFARNTRLAAFRPIRLWLVAGALPLAYEIFRMGYFGALVPNTALAKEAGLPSWLHGGAYFGDFFETYAFWAPTLIIVVWWLVRAHVLASARRWGELAAIAAPASAACLYTLFVFRVGGDFMHGRLLLPAVFCALLPLFVVRISLAPGEGRTTKAVFAVGVAWAIVCGFALRVSYTGIGPYGIADERSYYVHAAGMSNPVTLADYHGGASGEIRDLSLLHPGTFRVPGDAPADLQGAYLPFSPSVPREAWLGVSQDVLGIYSYSAGPDIFVVDVHGLADPVASRLLLDPERLGRPGHEKSMPYFWILAHYSELPTGTNVKLPTELIDAQQAYQCGDLHELLGATEDPLTVNRFARNLILSVRLTRLRIPLAAAEAKAQLCTG